MIETYAIQLTSGIELSCRASGRQGQPVLVFLHGVPEGAFVWDELLEHFAGAGFRCIAPNLRGFEHSSSPAEVEAYRAKHLVADLSGLIDSLGGKVRAVVAHDWGGAVAWTFAALHPRALDRLVIINSPHPATFLRELRTRPGQQAASAYMHFLCRPDAEALLAADDFRRLWTFFTHMGAADPAGPGGGWLTEEVRERYRKVWSCGLTGGCNYYRASPLRPPLGPDDPVMTLALPPRTIAVDVPTLVVWGERDQALPVTLLDGLDEFVPRLRIVRVAEATHWIVHEQPALLAAEIGKALAG